MNEETPKATAGGSPLDGGVRPRAWALAIHQRFGGGDYVCRTPTENGLPYEPLYDQAAIDAAVAKERAWFVQVLSEWDRTEDVEEVLRLRLEGPNAKLTGP